MKKGYLMFFTFLIMINSCTKEDEVLTINGTDITREDEINFFVWRGLNAFYLWQKDVPVLANNFFNNEEEIYRYFRQFESPRQSFYSLLFAPGITDRFSVFVNDYNELEKTFQGISTSNGMEFKLFRYTNNQNNLFAVVEYVIPNTSASSTAIKRGMVFNKINNTPLTTSNYKSLLFEDSSSNYTIHLANYNNGNPTNTNTSISLAKFEFTENPILVANVFSEGTKKIGYLMYNQFNSSFDDELNTAFGNFKSQNINELIVDLRYNGGGFVQSAIYLGSMITGQFTGEVFSKQRWNTKVLNATHNDNFINRFTETIIKSEQPINTLNLSKVYFIVSNNTASASELVINALSAYIDVEIIGETTKGKQVGSITLYDSDNLRKSGTNLNSNHKYAMQPLVFESVNKNNQNDINGYTPEIDIPGILLKEDYENLGVLGTKSDPLLDATIKLITKEAKSTFKKSNSITPQAFYSSKFARPMSNNMYFNIK